MTSRFGPPCIVGVLFIVGLTLHLYPDLICICKTFLLLAIVMQVMCSTVLDCD